MKKVFFRKKTPHKSDWFVQRFIINMSSVGDARRHGERVAF